MNRPALVGALVLAGACSTTTPPAVDRAPAAAVPPKPVVPGLRLPRVATPRRQSVELTIVPDEDAFTGRVAIEIDLAAPTDLLWLNAKQIQVRTAFIESGESGGAGGARQVARPLANTGGDEFLGLRLDRPVGPGPAVVHIDYRGTLVLDDYIGLFRERDGDVAYVFSQFEISDARRAFPCFDEPGFKIPWHITLHVRSNHAAIASSPVARETPGPEPGMKTVEFQPTRPLPSYLLAFAVGPLEIHPAGMAGQNRVPHAIAAPPGLGGTLHAAMTSTPEFVAELERYTGIPYPYEKLDSVAVPHFYGAMENASHITYAKSILLTDPDTEKTPRFQQFHRSVVAHELAHQWFGGLVTLAWWDDLWLNESFATWIEQKISRKVDTGVESLYNVGDPAAAKELDARPSARAIRQPITRRDDFLFLFDPITYGKGAAVLTMFEHWLGEETFRAAVRAYLTGHAHGNATSADFLAAVDAAAPGRAAAAAIATFLDQPGVPLVTIERRCAPGSAPALTLRQERLLRGAPPAAPSPLWRIPVCVEVGSAGRAATATCALLDQASATVELERCPAWVNGNADAVGYYRVAYGGDLLAAALSPRTSMSPRERRLVLDDAVALADAGRLPYGVLLAALPALGRERDFGLLRRAVLMTANLEDLVPAERRDRYAALVREAFGARARALGWTPRAGEPAGAGLVRVELLTLVAVQGRDRALAAETERLARAWLRDPSAVDPGVQRGVLAAAAAQGDAGLHDAYAARLAESTDPEVRGPLLAALGRFRDPALVARTVELAASPPFAFNEAEQLLAGRKSDRAVAEPVYREMVRRFAALVGKLGADRRIQLVDVASALCSDALADEADRFFAEKLAGAPGVATARASMREQIQLCAARHAAQSAEVARALEGP